MFKKYIAIASMVVISTTTFTGCSFNSNTPVIGKIVGLNDNQAMKIGKTVCSMDEAKLVLMNLQNKYKKDFGSDVSWEQKIGDTTLKKYIIDKAESDLSIIYAMKSIAEEKSITLSSDEKEKVSKAAKEYLDSLNAEEKSYSNATQETVEALYTAYYLADKVYDHETAGVSDTVSDEESRVMKIQYIYIDKTKSTEEAKKTLSNVKKQVENGYQDFLVQANKYTNASSVECNLKKNEASEEYMKKAFELSNGKISDVIVQDDGVYLVKCIQSYLEKETQENKKQIVIDNKIAKFNSEYSKYVKEKSGDLNKKVIEKIEFSNNKNIQNSTLFDVYNKYFAQEQ